MSKQAVASAKSLPAGISKQRCPAKKAELLQLAQDVEDLQGAWWVALRTAAQYCTALHGSTAAAVQGVMHSSA
jgi:hypothetical protein